MSHPHTELPLAKAQAHTCTCGEHDDQLPELDARAIPHAIRHASIFGALDSLAPGEAWCSWRPMTLALCSTRPGTATATGSRSTTSSAGRRPGG